MGDDADYAASMIEQVQAMQIAAIRQRGRELSPSGTCYNCEEPLSGAQLFCDSDCAYDYERLK